MRHADALTSAENDYVFAKPGEVYAIYLPEGGTTGSSTPSPYVPCGQPSFQ